MATTAGIRGTLLEEVVLRLIAASGYHAVSYNASKPDPTLTVDRGALSVYGRGEKHQIDTLADFFLIPPFSRQQLLLLEAKCYANAAVDWPVIRNAVGVLTDISQFWALPASPPRGAASWREIPRREYHYQSAVVSLSLAFCRSHSLTRSCRTSIASRARLSILLATFHSRVAVARSLSLWSYVSSHRLPRRNLGTPF